MPRILVNCANRGINRSVIENALLINAGDAVDVFFRERSKAAPDANANISVSRTHEFVELNYPHIIGISRMNGFRMWRE
jgi:hypothetical protein